MSVHENVIVDLLPLVRQGSASSESRVLVEEFLASNPAFARLAAMMPSPDPSLELVALRRTRDRLGRRGWRLGLALFFTLLPLSFIVDDNGFRLMMAGQPAMMAVSWAAGLFFWLAYVMDPSRRVVAGNAHQAIAGRKPPKG